jgi:hypothetical protein
MNWKKFFIAFIAAFVFLFAYDWVFHGMLLQNSYAATASLWRTKPDFSSHFPLLILGQIVIVFFFTLIFVRGFGSGGGTAGGFRYGILFGLLHIGANLIRYAVEPLTTNLIVSWSIGGLIEFAVAGAIVGALYKPGPTTTA